MDRNLQPAHSAKPWPNLPILLIVCNAASVGGDILFAFLWNSRLILSVPTRGLMGLGLTSTVGIVLGVFVGYRVARVKNQALFLAIGSTLRAGAMAGAALYVLRFGQVNLPVGLAVQLLDTIVITLTSGTIMTLLAERVPKERFTQLVALNQALNQAAMVIAWFLGGVLLAYIHVFGLLIVDFLSFIPVTVVLYYMAAGRGGMPRDERRWAPTPSRHRGSMSPYVLVFAGMVLFGSLISRTTPLLWTFLYVRTDVPKDVVLGVLFATFVLGMFTSGALAATKRGSIHLTLSVARRGSPAGLVLMVGLSIATLPLLGSHPLLFVIGLFFCGCLSGLLAPLFMAKMRESFEGLALRQAFYYVGIIGRFGEPVASAISGALLLTLGIRELYVISGAGMTLVATTLYLLAVRRWSPGNISVSSEVHK